MNGSIEEIIARLRKDFQLSIVTILGCLVVLVMAPFAIFRLFQGDWIIFALDVTVLLLALGIVLYAFFSHKSDRAALFLAYFVTVCLAIASSVNPTLTPYWMYCVILFNFALIQPNSALILVTLGFISIFSGDIVFADTTIRATYIVTTFSTTLFAYIFAVRTEHQKQILINLARTDPLTGASNRRAFDESVNIAIDTVRRQVAPPVTMVLIDIDHFKKVNDNFGHEGGDRVLIQLVQLISNHIRSSDRLFRIGGEEFCLMMDHTGKKAAITAAKKVCELVRSRTFINDYRVTISIGLSQINQYDSTESWTKRCDSALYMAKSQGRDRVVYNDAQASGSIN